MPKKLFPKGVSGNPGGRPKEDPKIREMFGKLIPLAFAAVNDCLHHDDADIRLKAANVVYDRFLGKPRQELEHTSDPEKPFIVKVEMMKPDE